MTAAGIKPLRSLAGASLVAAMLTGCGFTEDTLTMPTEAKSADLSAVDAGRIGTTPPPQEGAGSEAAAGGAENEAGSGDTKAPTEPPPAAAAPPAATPPAATPATPPAASTPTPPPPAASAKTNSVDIIISDMALMNDMPLKGVNPQYGFARGPGHVVMGNDPRGTNTPAWYKSSYPWMVSSNYWNYLLPWFVLFEGEGNTASNTRIHMRNMRVFTKSRSNGTWTQVNSSQNVGGILCPQGSNYFHCPTNGTVRSESGGGVSSLPIPGYNLHGWWGGRERINGPDVAAVFVTFQARLITNGSGPDDRSRARYLVQAGADYYPSNGSAEAVLPAVGISRAKMLSNEWQSYSMTTLSDYGKQEPGGGISSSELRGNPPPLD